MNTTVIVPANCAVESSEIYVSRFSFYSLWGSILLRTLFKPWEDAYETLKIILLFANLLALCKSGLDNSAVSVAIWQYLLIGPLSGLTLSGICRSRGPSGLFRIMFCLALSSYGCWFWFTGVDRFSRPGCPEIVFFGGVTPHSHAWFRTLCKVVYVAAVVLCAYLLVVNLWRTAESLWTNRTWSKPDESPRKRPQVELVLLLFSVALVGVLTYLVEYLIKVNGIEETGVSRLQGVYEWFQFLYGSLRFMYIIRDTIFHGLYKRKRCWFIFGCHL
ncbi:hypothetical protein GGI42DRAFT_337641 [Trichoderma sp. SZMC 28013]